MVQIHGIAWFLIGVVITIISFLVELTFFIYIGFAFMIFGAIRLLMRFTTKPKETKFDKRIEGSVARGPQYCARCGTAGQGNFCRRCGMKL